MPSIDDLIVAMKFDNKQFEAAARISMATLAQLKGNLNFPGSRNGIDQAADSMAKFNAGPMNTQIDGISAKFLALGTIAATALSNITNKVIDTGSAMAKSFTTEPITAGFQEYELKMRSIQTILANTSKDGTTLKEVTANLEELNTYADQTIYNFGDMTKNIGLFTNAGIGIKDATAMIKGFSNEAAASGTSAEGAAGAAYQLSQGLSAGVLTAQDWISLTNVGMGNANMKDGIIQIAEAMGAFEGTGVTANEAAKDFKGTLEKKWLKADVMENYLKLQAEGEEKVNFALAKQIGLSDEQARAFYKQQQISQDAATKVRTFTQLMDTLKEGVGSSWASTFDLILGDFDSATVLFTGISKTVGGFIGNIGEKRNELLKGWAAMGGRDLLLDGLKNSAEALFAVIKPIGQAFRQIFPAKTAADLFKMTQAFQQFTAKLKVGSETANNIKRTFAGVFAVFGIAVELIKGVVKGIGSLFGAFGKGTGGILSFTGSIGDFLVKLHESIKTSGIFTKIFTSIAGVLQAPIALIGGLGVAAGNALGALSQLGAAAKQAFDILFKGDTHGGPLGEEDGNLVGVLYNIHTAMSQVADGARQLFDLLFKGDFTGGGPFSEDSPIVSGILDFRDKLKSIFSPEALAGIFTAGGAAAIGFGLYKMFRNGLDMLLGKKDGGILGELKGAFTSVKDAFENVGGMFDTLTNSLKTMQNNVKTTMILKIAVAVGILAGSMALLATIDPIGLAQALGAVTVSMGLLVGALAVISKIAGAPGIVQMPVIAAGLAILAVAVGLLAISVKAMSTLSLEELGKGLGAVAIMLGLLVGAALLISKSSGPLLRAGLAMIPLAIGLNLIALAVRQLGSLSITELAKGMGAFAIAMTVLAAALLFMPKGMPAIGLGLALVGAGMLAISGAISILAGLSITELVKGMVGFTIAMGVLSIAMNAMPKDMPLIGAGLLLVGIGMVAIASAISTIGSLSVGDLAKGLVGMGVALVLLSVSLNAMQGAMGGAVALGVAAIGLTMLLGPILAMAALSWGSLVQGLVGFAAVLTVLGVGAYLLAPVAPILVAIGLGVAALGLGLMAIGGAAYVFALALQQIINVIMSGKDAIGQLLLFIPQLATAFANAIVQFVVTIGENAVAIAEAFGKVLGTVLDVLTGLVPKAVALIGALLSAIIALVITYVPQFAQTFLVLLDAFLNAIVTAVPRIVQAGFDLLSALLTEIANRIPELIQKGTDVVVAFINGIAAASGQIINAAFNMIITFMNNLEAAIRANSQAITDAALGIGDAIIDGVVNALGAGIGKVIEAAKGVASSAINAAKNLLGIASPSKEFYKIGGFVVAGFVTGMNDGNRDIGAAASSMATSVVAEFTKTAGKTLPKAIDSIFETIEAGFKNEKFSTANTGMTNGFKNLGSEIWKAELAFASFMGEVNTADPKSVEEYANRTGGKLKYLAGLMDGLRETAKLAFDQLSEGKSLPEVLGGTDFLTSILDTGLSIIPGIEGTLITAGVKLGLAVGDGILKIFMGPNATIIGTVGKWITKLVRAIGGWFGIKFPVEEELSESDKALQDFMVKVDDGHGRFEKLSEEAVKGLKDTLDEANEGIDGVGGNGPVVRPVLDLVQWDKDVDKFLDSLNTGPGFGVFNVLFGGIGSFFGDISRGIQGFFNPVQSQPKQITQQITQTITSPKAVDHVEVYKSTKSLMSLAKEELGIS